jgi:hypothetical protein
MFGFIRQIIRDLRTPDTPVNIEKAHRESYNRARMGTDNLTEAQLSRPVPQKKSEPKTVPAPTNNDDDIWAVVNAEIDRRLAEDAKK